MNRELEMAAKVQQELFPRILPHVPGLDYAGTCKPARGVSGDYYDFISLGEGRLGMLLADVSGKGVPAALLGASLHAAVRANASAAWDRCGEVLAKTNTLLFETTTADRFATVFYGVYDPEAKALTYANAGHCPPMLVRQGTCVRLDSLTPPVGMFPVLAPAQKSVALMPGDWLIIFSDGIPEAANLSGEEFGDQRLLQALIRIQYGTAAAICGRVLDEVREHIREQRQADDITLITARVL